MATPSPSSVATVGAVVGKVVAAASSPTNDRPASTLSRADRSGMAAAAIEANMNSSSTSAQVRPMISELLSLVAWPIWPAPAPYSTCSPAARAGLTAVSSSLRYALSSVAGTTFHDTVP